MPIYKAKNLFVLALLLSFGGRVFLHPLRLSLNIFAGLRTTPDNLHHCTTAPKFLDRDFQTVPKFLDGWGFLFSLSLSEFLEHKRQFLDSIVIFRYTRNFQTA